MIKKIVIGNFDKVISFFFLQFFENCHFVDIAYFLVLRPKISIFLKNADFQKNIKKKTTILSKFG